MRGARAQQRLGARRRHRLWRLEGEVDRQVRGTAGLVQLARQEDLTHLGEAALEQQAAKVFGERRVGATAAHQHGDAVLGVGGGLDSDERLGGGALGGALRPQEPRHEQDEQRDSEACAGSEI